MTQLQDERDALADALGKAHQEIERLREALRIALDAMHRSADDHNCDYCRADIAAVEARNGRSRF